MMDGWTAWTAWHGMAFGIRRKHLQFTAMGTR